MGASKGNVQVAICVGEDDVDREAAARAYVDAVPILIAFTDLQFIVGAGLEGDGVEEVFVAGVPFEAVRRTAA